MSLADLKALTKHLYPELLDLAWIAPAASAEPAGTFLTLSEYETKISQCQACEMHLGRNKLVFGRGAVPAKIVFVGDFPAAGDDKNGKIFSDEAGDLLRKMIVAMKLRPEETYLVNLIQCRPPAKEIPTEDHFEKCLGHLNFQLHAIQAKIIVALGERTAQFLARSDAPMNLLRGQILERDDSRIFTTYHPRELLLRPDLKKESWSDLQKVMRFMGNL